jgi:hypothetical protein
MGAFFSSFFSFPHTYDNLLILLDKARRHANAVRIAALHAHHRSHIAA